MQSRASRLALTALATTALLGSQSARANTYDWSGATNGNMSGTPANWGGTAPTGTDVARWNSATYTNAPTANAAMTIGELLFDAGNTGGVTFGAGTSTLTLNGISGVGIQLNNGSGAVSTGSAKFSLGGDQTWLNNSANTFTVGGTITNASTTIARTLTLDGTGSTILNGIISNNTATTTLTKSGSGTLTLGGANTFTGGLNIQQGTVKYGANAGAGAGLITIGSVGNSAVLDLNGSGSRTINALATAGTAANQTITNSSASAATFNYNGATTSTFGGVIENGSGGGTTAVVVNNASANLTLSGANTYTGTTTVTAGTLKIGATNAIASGNALTTAAAGTFDLNGYDQTIGILTHAGTITNSSVTTKTLTFGSSSASTGAGGFTGAMNVIFNNAAGVSTLTGSWSNTGNISLNANNGNTVTLSTGTINNTGTITNSGSSTGAVIISGNIGSNVGLITENSAGSALTLSGTNTNTGGVTLTAGILKLGSTTALGATASTLTVGAGTTLDSTVSNLVLANNNAVNLNGNVTFTGTQSLNLGTGAVTIAAPLTLTTTANTLTLGGTISGGTIFDITKAGAGTLVYGGTTVMTSDQTANVTAGTLALTGNITGGYGVTVNGPATLSLRGSTGNAAASAVTVNSGSVLALDSSATGVTGTTRAASVNLKGATLNVLGNSTTNSIETITGALTANVPSTFGSTGASTVTLTPDAAMNTRLSADTLTRANNGTVFFRGANLGANTIASNTAGAANIKLTSAPTGVNFVGGGGAAGTQNISIIPWAVGSTAATGAPTSFVTYDANGIRPLSSGEYATTITALTTTSNNIKLDGTSLSTNGATLLTVTGAATVNSLFLTNGTISGSSTSSTILAGTGALTVTSGAIYMDLANGGNNNVTVISKPIDFVTTEGVIGTTGTSNSKTLSFTGGISGSGGVTIYDTNVVSSTQAGVAFSAATSYTGNTVINGSLIVSVANSLPNFANSGRTGDVYVNGTLGLSGSNPIIRINGLYGSGRIITPFSNNATLAVGDNNATSTFDGVITQTSGAIGLTKVGTGTLTLTGTSNTWTATTNIQNGTLSVATLNNIATPTTSSSLGRPTTGANGTIGLGATTTAGTLKVNGTGETTDRVINLAGTTGGGTIDQSGTGLLKFTSDFTATGNGLKTLTLTGSSAGTGEIAGAIVNSTSATSVTKAGTGTWTLSGTNSYTGVTTLSDGTLSVGTIGNGAVAGNLGQASNAAANLVFDGGTLNYTGANATSDRAFTINAGKTATINSANSLSFAGATGTATTGGLTKTGAGTLTLTGTNTYTGATSVTGGALQLDGSTAAGSTVGIGTAGSLTGSGTVNGNATLTGSGIINKSAGAIAGTLAVTGGNWNGAGSVTGATTSSSGTFTIGNGANLTANGGLNVTGGTLAAGNSASTITGSVNYTSASNSTFNGTLAGSGKTLTMNNSAASLTLGGTNTYTGATTVSNGSLIVSGSIASSATTVGSGATLALSGSGTAGAVTVNSGTFQLGTAGTAGAVTINDGTLGGVGTVNSLAFTGTSAFGPGNSPGTITIANGGSFTLSSDTTSTFQFTSSGFGVGTFDLVNTSGTATGSLAGILNLDFTGTGYTAGTNVTFIDLTSITGTFSTVNVTGLTGLIATVNYDNAAGDVYVSLASAAIPEPSTYALFAGAGLLLFAVVRRKIRSGRAA